MKKRALFAALAVGMSLSMLAGCAKKEDEVKTLSIMWFNDGKEGEVLQKLADQYEETHKNIKIEIIESPYGDFEEKIKNMINGNQPPAMARLTNATKFSNQLVDLGEYVANKEEFVNSFGPGPAFLDGDRVIAAPMEITVDGMIYNKTAFDKAGIVAPTTEDNIWTWDQWKDAMKTVIEKGGCKYGLALDRSNQRFTNLVYEAGGSMLNEDLTEANWNCDGTKRAIEFLKELHDENLVPDSIWLGAENGNEMFRTGQIGMHIGGSWQVAAYKDQITDFEWGVAHLPYETERAAIPGGKTIAAFKGSGVEKEAAEFIEWISKKENNAVYCKENLYLSPVKGNEALDYEYGADFFKIFAEDLAASSLQPTNEWGWQVFTSKATSDMRSRIQSVLTGEMTVDECVELQHQTIAEALAEVTK